VPLSNRIPNRPRGPAFAKTPAMPFLALLLLLCGTVFAGDTTYSRTEAVPRVSEASATPVPGSSRPGSLGDDDATGHVGISLRSGGNGQGFMAACMDINAHAASLQEALGLLILWPLWMGVCGMADGVWTSHAHLFGGAGEMDAWQTGRWRPGMGFGVGAAWMSGIVGGMPLEFDLELTGALAEGLQLRLRADGFLTLMGSDVDYRRDVYVDGKYLGGQLDVMTGYRQKGVFYYADLIRLLGGRGLYLAGGVGGGLMDESIEYVRENGFAHSVESRSEDRLQFLPALDAGLGRYGGGGGRSFWRFEIRYQAIFHSPLRATSFPGDNAYVTQAVTWQWAWF
jgi:hypothetical protein